MIPLHCLYGKLLSLVIQMNLFNNFLCPLGTPPNTGYTVNKKYNKQNSMDIWCSFSVLKAGTYVTEISSRSCGAVEHKIGAKYLAADVCGRC